MHPVRKQRLLLVLFVVVFSSAAIGLMVYALRGNINLFFPPAEVAAGNAPVGQPIRVGGMVVEGSVERSQESVYGASSGNSVSYASCRPNATANSPATSSR